MKSARPFSRGVQSGKVRAPNPGAQKDDEPHGNTPNSCEPERIPSQWSWHYRTLVHLRERLLRAPAEPSAARVTPDEMCGVEVLDHADQENDRELLWKKLENLDDKLFEVDCALQRIHDGVYGFCEKTGHPIPAERLRETPWARYALAETQPLKPELGPPRQPGKLSEVKS